MSDDGLSKSATLEGMRAQRLLKKDPRYYAASEISRAAEEIRAPAYMPERSAAKVIGGTLAGVARAEALRKTSESLPQNQLKARLDAEADILTEETGRGALFKEIS